MWRDLLQEPGPAEHITHYYRDDSFLHDTLATWFIAPLKHNGGIVVLCTDEKWDMVRSAISSKGRSPRKLLKQGRIVRLDVDAFLESFLKDGIPDERVFVEQIESALWKLDAVVGDGEVRAWGEAVEILRRRNEFAAAEALEVMWNKAISKHGFRLLCSYQVHNLEPSTHRPEIIRLDEQHSHLIPEEDYARLNEAVDKALGELYGEEVACTVWAKLWSRTAFHAKMPAGESVLKFFGRHHPEKAHALFDRVKRHYMAQPLFAVTP